MVASFSQIEPYLIQSESSGRNLPSSANYNYPVSTASGYYQITNSTWAGIPTSITGGTQSAYQAPFAQQQAAAQYLWNQNNGYDWLGISPQTGQPWNSTAVAANAALMSGQTPNIPLNSAVTGLPLSGAGGANGGSGITITAPSDFSPSGGINDNPYSSSDPIYSYAGPGVPGTSTSVSVPSAPSGGSIANTGVLGGLTGAAGTGGNVNVGLQPSTVQDITSWITSPITAFEKWAGAMAEQGINWFERGFLIFLAIVIIFVALWRLSGERGSGGSTRIVPIPA